MDLVIDANVLFSVLIKIGKTEELMLHEDIQVFAPEFIFEEFDKVYTTNYCKDWTKQRRTRRNIRCSQKENKNHP